MRRLINSLSGNEMWVADNRVDKYLAAGHKLAAELPAVTQIKEPEEKPEKKPVKKTVKKTIRKR